MTEKHKEDNCALHFDKKDGNKRDFTPNTYQTFLSKRDEWLSLGKDYKEFTEVARRSLDIIPPGTKFNHITKKNNAYHSSCYQLFTNKNKLERARRSEEIPVLVPSQSKPVESSYVPPPSKRSLRVQLRKQHETNSHPNEPEPSSSNILPKKCLVCNSYDPIYVWNSKVCQILCLNFQPIYIFFTTTNDKHYFQRKFRIILV